MPRWNRITFLCLGLTILFGYLTYMHNYQYPDAFYWDENYHVAMAQKYLNSTFFMHYHPPLGKMLIALGEKLIDANPNDAEFLTTGYARNPSENFSLVGYRFFPALFAWMTAPVIFLLFLTLTRQSLLALFFSFFYVFDNALIVHFRGAMLDGFLFFFIALSLLFWLLTYHAKNEEEFSTFSLFFGVSFGLALATKATALILILLIPALAWKERKHVGKAIRFMLLSGIPAAAVFLVMWWTHFQIATQHNPELKSEGFYGMNEAHRSLVTEGHSDTLAAFPIMLKEAFAYTKRENKGVPALNLCKEGENGSPFFYWPLGARSINYRWRTPNGEVYQYLYLQANPAVWWLSLAGVLLGVGLVVVSFLFPLKQKLEHRYMLMIFLGLYGSYMVAISRLDRVMYLYHYFPPLLFSFIITCLVFLELKQLGKWKLNEDRRVHIMTGVAAVIFASFLFYRPLTYYLPLTNEQFERRAILRLWDLDCVKCNTKNIYANPVAPKK